MAGITRPGNTLKLLVFVAMLTSHVRMFSLKRKTSFAVIKFNLVPLFFRVTVRAGWPERSPMAIVFFMAREAGRWRMAELHPWQVAGFTLHFGMRALQEKVRLPVIKGLPIEWRDIRASSFMLGMTVFAFPNLTNPSVKPLLLS